MNDWVKIWLACRALRWGVWVAFFGTAFYIVTHRSAVLTSFGHLQTRYEVMLMAIGTAAVFAGFLEVAMRGRAGLASPALGQLIPPRK